MHYSRQIIGHHGCDEDVATALLNGAAFQSSENKYDWLGHGIYFWEYGLERALQFARDRRDNPATISALIQLGNCLDLLDTSYAQQLSALYDDFTKNIQSIGKSLPVNTIKGAHVLDCAMINLFCEQYKERTGVGIDTVRGMFIEGEPIYPGSKLSNQSHIQIAVRNPKCVLGVFRTRR